MAKECQLFRQVGNLMRSVNVNQSTRPPLSIINRLFPQIKIISLMTLMSYRRVNILVRRDWLIHYIPKDRRTSQNTTRDWFMVEVEPPWTQVETRINEVKVSYYNRISFLFNGRNISWVSKQVDFFNCI
jgi:hypothetical protein